jgi:hypothetical protein
MSEIQVQVQLAESALKEFKTIQNHENSLVSQWGAIYLTGLVDLPPQSWLVLRRKWTRGFFKMNDFIPFDIRGKVVAQSAAAGIVVIVTRFKLKKQHSKIWFEKNRRVDWAREYTEWNWF